MASDSRLEDHFFLCFLCSTVFRLAADIPIDESSSSLRPLPITDDIAECASIRCSSRQMYFRCPVDYQKQIWVMKHWHNEKDVAALDAANVICAGCRSLAVLLLNGLEITGDPDRARRMSDKMEQVEVAESGDKCELPSCYPRAMLAQDILTPEQKAAQMSPLCKPCHGHFQTKQMSDEFKQILELIDTTLPADFCNNPDCLSRGGPKHTSHCCGDPDICNCEEPEFKDDHKQILAYIKKIETLHKKLKVQYGVTQQLREQTRGARNVDPVMPLCMQDELGKMTKMVNELSFGDDKIETKPGRPLCHVPEEEFSCHLRKINAYAPANCDCTKAACACTCCISQHLRHSVEDYEDAVSRVAVNITKLRAMPRSDTAPKEPVASTEPHAGGSGMPGVRKAKHLKGYTKAQKDAYNKKK